MNVTPWSALDEGPISAPESIAPVVTRPADKLDSVQVLRALAAVAVVTHHIRLFGNGAWGVDLFFVISGFIMCFVTEHSGAHFFTKRVIRVVPLYWAGTLGIFCLALVLPGFLRETHPGLVQLLKSLLFIPYRTGENVFPIMFLGWTLNYEMFFYLLFALSMAISHAYRAVICSAMLAALALIGWWVEFDWVVAEFFTESIVLEFAFGMFAYSVFARTAQWRARAGNGVRTVMVIAGLALIACMPLMTAQSEALGRPLAWGLLALGAFLLVVHGLAHRRLPRIAVLVGDASYSLYLFHPYVLNVFNRVFHPDYDSPSPGSYALALLAVALCCTVAILLYRWLELPLTKGLRGVFLARRAAPRPSPDTANPA